MVKKNFVNIINNRFPKINSAYIVGLVIISVLLIFAYFDPKSSVFRIHDFLDHIFVLNYLRGKDLNILDIGANIENIFDGVPNSALGINDFSLEHNLYWILNPFLAATINDSFARLVGYSALFGIVVTLFHTNPYRNKIALISSLYFGLAPYIPTYVYTLAFQALIVYCIILITKDKKRKIAWIGLFVSTQFSSFTYGGFALVLILFVWVMYLIIIKSDLSRIISRIFLLVSFGYGIGLIKTFYLLFFTNFESHRTEWAPLNPILLPVSILEKSFNIMTIIRNLTIFGDGNSFDGLFPFRSNLFYNYIPGVMFIIIVVGLVRFTSKLVSARKNKSYMLNRILRENFNFKCITIISAFILVFSIPYALESTNTYNLAQLMPIPFQFSRFTSLLSLSWSLLAAAVLVSIFPVRSFSASIFLNLLIVVTLFQGVVTHVGIQGRLLNLTALGREQTIEEYYDVENYRKIKKLFDGITPQYKVLSVGTDPMIAAFNGMSTLDGYVYNYPVEYKHKFREIIVKELDKDLELRSYYDHWGSRVYMFLSSPKIEESEFNWCAASKMGAKFVISPLEMDKKTELKRVGKVQNISLFKLNDKLCS